MLLWNSCNSLRFTTMSNQEKADLVSEAWSGIRSLWDSFGVRDCNLDTALMYICAESMSTSKHPLASSGNQPELNIIKVRRLSLRKQCEGSSPLLRRYSSILTVTLGPQDLHSKSPITNESRQRNGVSSLTRGKKRVLNPVFSVVSGPCYPGCEICGQPQVTFY